MNAERKDPATDPQLTQEDASVPTAYAPSFVDLFTDFIRQLPIPYGITFFTLFILEGAILLILSWIDGWLPVYAFSPIAFEFPLWLWAPLLIITYLDSLALESLSEFGPLLDISEETRQRLGYEFTTMPASGVFLNALAWLGFYFLAWYLFFRPAVITDLGFGRLATRSFLIAGFFSFSVGGAIYYHTVRQLRLVSRTVRMVSQFDLFRLDPVYAFSILTSRTGIGWVLLPTLTLLTVPLQLGRLPLLALMVSQLVFAMGAFLLPLRIVNQRLVSEKQAQLADLDQRVKAILDRLHRHIDEDSLQEVRMLTDVLKGLTAEREILTKIPTWPWRPGLFAGFVSIVLLPVVLFLIQFGLGRWLGP